MKFHFMFSKPFSLNIISISKICINTIIFITYDCNSQTLIITFGMTGSRKVTMDAALVTKR